METYQYLNILGLSLDIIGVCILFFYDPTNKKTIRTLINTLNNLTDNNIKKTPPFCEKWIPRIALFLILIGFAFQLISIFVYQFT